MKILLEKTSKIKELGQVVVAHAFNISTQEAEAGRWISGSSRPVWSTRASSRTARAVTQRNPVLKNKQTKLESFT